MTLQERLHCALLLAGCRAVLERKSIIVVPEGNGFRLTDMVARPQRAQALRVDPGLGITGQAGDRPVTIGSVKDLITSK